MTTLEGSRCEVEGSALIELQAELVRLEVKLDEMPGLVQERRELWQSCIDEGIPVAKVSSPKISVASFAVLLEQVNKIVARFDPGVLPQINRFRATFQEDPDAVMNLIDGMLGEESEVIEAYARRYSLDADFTRIVLFYAVRPFLVSYSRQLMEHCDLSRWDKGFCPYCGRNPAIARLDNASGKRFLYCFLCGTEWSFMRIGCPFCMNDDQETLGFIVVEGKEAYRVYVCERCNGCIRTIDERRLNGEKVDMAYEEIRTRDLDLLAQCLQVK